MISVKVKSYLKDQEWWFEDASDVYLQALHRLGVGIDTEFSDFFLHAEDGPTFNSKGKEIYHVCWWAINSNYELDISRTHEVLKLPDEMLPLDGFDGEHGYFYSKLDCKVYEYALSSAPTGAVVNIKSWDDFNSFLEFFFDIA